MSTKKAIPFAYQDHELPVDVIDIELRTKLLYAQRSTADMLTLIEKFDLYELQDELCQRLDIGYLELLVIFRGYGKSTMLEEVASKELAYYPDSFVMYYSTTDEAAEDHVNAVLEFFTREELPETGEKNPFNQLVPQKGEPDYTWNKKNAILKNGNRIAASGTGKFVLGKKFKKMRPTLIIIDDPTNPEEPGSAAKTVKWLRQVIIPMGGPRTRILMAGVVYFIHDVIMTFMLDTHKVFNLFYLPAINKAGDITAPEWWMRQGACCADNLKKCGELSGMELAWQHIAQKRDEVGAEWATQFMLKPVDDDSSLFPMKHLNACRVKGWTFTDSRKLYTKESLYQSGVQEYRSPTVIGCDHAFTKNKSSDWSVFTVLRADPNPKIKWMVLDAFVGKVGIEEAKAILVRLNELYQPALIYSEENGAGIAFAEDWSHYTRIMPIQKYFTGSEKHKLSIGLPSMKNLIEVGNIQIPSGIDKADDLSQTDLEETLKYCNELFAQLNGLIMQEGQVVSITPHDDYALSLWLAIQAARDFQTYAVTDYGAVNI